jgi:hypothetical protein
MGSRQGNACIAFHVTVAGVILAKQVDPWKYASKSTNIIWGMVYWKNKNWPNTCTKKATKYIGTKLGSYKLNLTPYTRNWPTCLCSATQSVNPVWTYFPSGFLSSERKLESFYTVQFNSYLYHCRGNWKVMSLLYVKNLWACLNFTWLISKQFYRPFFGSSSS